MATKRQKRASHSPVTLTDVARRAGVSPTAVSFVLNENGQRNKHVSEETRAKVLQAVQDLNFRPDALARALSKGQSEEIALILWRTLSPVMADFYAIELITSIQRPAASYGYACVLYPSEDLSAEQWRDMHERIFARHPLGILASPTAFTTEDVALARQMGVKHIIFLSDQPVPIEQTYTIVFPSRALGYLAAQHLLERGHRHLALVQPGGAGLEAGFLQRLEGMHAAIDGKPGVTLDILPLSFSATAARSLAETKLVGPHRPTGIYAFNDELAVVLLGALTRLGIQVPQEVALVGTDNLPIGEVVWPSLTSMRFDTLDIGPRAVEMFHTLQQGLPLPEELTRPLVPQLIQRESS
ncbi:MAG: LacI family DNA-binding transcriptional regulator [Chloroflexi bacterium]|nr:LacI family DNA-binding transcriptional regulator [Chloroflexota bacterium]